MDNIHLEPYTKEEGEEVRYEEETVGRMEKDINNNIVIVCPSPPLYSHNLSDLVTHQAVLLSVASAAIAIGTRLELKSNPTFLALDRSAIPAETIVVQPVQEAPPRNVLDAIKYFYISSLLSLSAAFLATLAKDCVQHYFLHIRVPAIDRNRYRQLKFAAFKRLGFVVLFLSPPALVRAAVSFLIFGVGERLRESNSTAIYIALLAGAPGLVGYFWTLFFIM